nr:WXG100 family type VII secretion target [Nocardia transvalensis]
MEMLENVESRVAGFVGFCRDQLEAIEHSVGSTQQRWTGDAADAYQSRHTDWLHRAAEAMELLDQVRTRLTTARKAYQGALDANTTMFG